jgi:RNA polymerase sigma factor (sigma-70 family)
VQEVFLSIYLQRSRYDNERGTVKTWILHSVQFKALTRRRQIRGTLLDSIEDGYANQHDLSVRLHSNVPDSDRIRWIGRGLSSLNNRQRRVIELVHFEGHTLLESSKLLSESLANTRNLYYRGMKLLRESLMPPRVHRVLDTNVKLEETILLEGKTPSSSLERQAGLVPLPHMLLPARVTPSTRV